MAKTPAEKVFDRYNPAGDVVRAPHGRAKIFEEARAHAEATSGVITRL